MNNFRANRIFPHNFNQLRVSTSAMSGTELCTVAVRTCHDALKVIIDIFKLIKHLFRHLVHLHVHMLVGIGEIEFPLFVYQQMLVSHGFQYLQVYMRLKKFEVIFDHKKIYTMIRCIRKRTDGTWISLDVTLGTCCLYYYTTSNEIYY